MIIKKAKLTIESFLSPRFFKKLLAARAVLTRILKPKSGYFLFKIPKRNLQPLSRKYGFDRGQPIDRFYIEKFLKENESVIKGACLEIHDNDYTVRFGKNKVIKSDILDIDQNNKQATIYGDLRNLQNIQKNTYDCLIITQTLGMIDDYEAAVREIHRILKPDGCLLLTVSATAPILDPEKSFWRFTQASINYIFGKYFKKNKMQTKSYGNVLAGQAFWVGLAVEDMEKSELEFNDPLYPLIIALRAYK